MNTDEKMEERKRNNAPFLAAFDYMARIRTDGNYSRLAKLLRTNGSLISDYKSGRKRVSQEMMARLFAFSESKLNWYYLLGVSDYMLAENVPDEEIAEMVSRYENPDFDVVKSKEKTSVSDAQKKPSEPSPENDETMASKDETIAALKNHIEYLQKQIDAKDIQIREMQGQISALIANIKKSEQADYSFGIGAADELRKNKKNT